MITATYIDLRETAKPNYLKVFSWIAIPADTKLDGAGAAKAP